MSAGARFPAAGRPYSESVLEFSKRNGVEEKRKVKDDKIGPIVKSSDRVL